MTLSAKGINEVWNEIFLFGTFFQGFLFVFDDDFVVGNFNDFFARDSEFGVDESFDERAFDDDLLDLEIVGIDGEIDKLTEFGAFFGFDFEGEEIEIEFEDLFDMDDVVWANEFIDIIDNHAIIGVFTNGINVENISALINEWTSEAEGNDLKIIGIDDGRADLTDGAASLNT